VRDRSARNADRDRFRRSPDTTTPHFFEIDETGTTNVIFKIDGTTVCTNTTNLPAASGVLGEETVNAFLTVTALGASTKDWEYAYIWSSYDK
jgi:hypothetical protein